MGGHEVRQFVDSELVDIVMIALPQAGDVDRPRARSALQIPFRCQVRPAAKWIPADVREESQVVALRGGRACP